MTIDKFINGNSCNRFPGPDTLPTDRAPRDQAFALRELSADTYDAGHEEIEEDAEPFDGLS